MGNALSGDDYDLVIDASEIGSILGGGDKGWSVEVSNSLIKRFGQDSATTESLNDAQLAELVKKISLTCFQNQVIVGVHGLFNRGKTFVLNKLADAGLPSERRIATKGLSFKVPVRRRDLNCIFMDTAGHGAPLRQKEIASMNATPPTETPGNTPTGPVDDALLRRKISEDFLRELSFAMSDVVIIVLHELSWNDQEYLSSVSAEIQKHKKQQNYIIVIHNYYNTLTKIELEDITKHFIEECFIVEKKEQIWEEEKARTTWWKNKDGLMRHVVLAREGSEAGKLINDLTIKLIRTWLLPLNIEREETLIKLFCSKAHHILHRYVGNVDQVTFKMRPTSSNNSSWKNINGDTVQLIRESNFYIQVVGTQNQQNQENQLLLLHDQLQHQGFRFVLATRNKYELPIDVVKVDNGLLVLCDLPMLNSGNVRKVPGPYKNFNVAVQNDAASHKAVLSFAGIRESSYYKPTLAPAQNSGELKWQATDECVVYNQETSSHYSRQFGAISSPSIIIPGNYEPVPKMKQFKDGVLHVYFAEKPKTEDTEFT